MANFLVKPNYKSLIAIITLLLLFITSLYYWFYLKSPSIATAFQEQSLKLNYHAFKSSLKNAHLYYQVKNNPNCLIDCYVRNNIGLDFNKAGYPISTRFINGGNNVTKNYFVPDLNDQDCALLWKFLMGPLHNSINSKRGDYLANWDTNKKICVYKTIKVLKHEITYDSSKGVVKLIEKKPTNTGITEDLY
ncbi:MAG: hypothetical protein ACPGJI_01900 [Kangiellaceae bacterium]